MNIKIQKENGITTIKPSNQNSQLTIKEKDDHFSKALNEIIAREKRIELLENNSTPIKNGTLPNYFKYLSSSDRKNIVCGYAEDNRLEHIEDLGWSCDLRYRTSRGGRESVSCRCKRP